MGACQGGYEKDADWKIGILVGGEVGMPYFTGFPRCASLVHLLKFLLSLSWQQEVFCSDMTFDATFNGVLYENGEPMIPGWTHNIINLSDWEFGYSDDM